MQDYGAELSKAKETLLLSRRVADDYVRSLGALAPKNLILPAHLGTRTGFQKTVLSDRYWFAKLYELITYFEIRDRGKFTHPGFVMHFIPVFYDMYYQALRSSENRGGRSKVSALWKRHLEEVREGGRPVPAGSMDGVMRSIVTGVTAHIQGDMAAALETAYTTWKAGPKPAFADLKADFFEKNRPTFDAAKAAFFLDLQDKGPFPFRPEVGQMLIGVGEKVINGGLDIDEVYKWRETAWNAVVTKLGLAAAAAGVGKAAANAAASAAAAAQSAGKAMTGH